MKEPVKWGRVISAGLFALVAIGGATAIEYLTHMPPKNTSAGATASAQVSASGSIVPANGVTAAISQDAVSQYLSAADQNGNISTDDATRITAGVVQQYVSAPQVVPVVALADLNVSASDSLDTYQQLFVLIMDQSTRVPEYEVDAFARVVTNGTDATSTAELQGDADLYKRIAAALLVMQVPTALAPEHLEVVKSVGALAHAVEEMGDWNGDPIQALVDVDTFNKSAAYVKSSVSDLASAVASAQKKT